MRRSTSERKSKKCELIYIPNASERAQATDGHYCAKFDRIKSVCSDGIG